jgi:hypothetical protein
MAFAECEPKRQEDAMNAGAEHEVPPAAAMMGLITGYWVSQAVGVVAMLGVADQLGEGPRGSDEVARAVGADPQALYRVLRLLASLGVFAEGSPGSFALTPLGETLRSDAPGSVRNFAITETAPGHWLPWGRLDESVRSGRPMAREALGMELFDWYAQNPEEAGFFSAAMGNLSALAAGELLVPRDRGREVLDADPQRAEAAGRQRHPDLLRRRLEGLPRGDRGGLPDHDGADLHRPLDPAQPQVRAPTRVRPGRERPEADLHGRRRRRGTGRARALRRCSRRAATS